MATNFDLHQNEDKQLTITVSGIDVTTADAMVFVMSNYGTAVITKTLANGGIVATSSTVATVTIDAADTASLEVGYYPYQFWIENASGKDSVTQDGTVTLNRDYRS